MNLTEIILNTMWCKNGNSSTNYCKSIGNSSKEKIIDLDNSTITSPNGNVYIEGCLHCYDANIQSYINISETYIHTNENNDLVFSTGNGNFVVPKDKYGTIATQSDVQNIKLKDLKAIGIAACELMKAIPVLSSQTSSMSKIEEIEDILDSQDIDIEGA